MILEGRRKRKNLNMGKILAISGLSGSGKTTLGKYLQEKILPNSTFIDQDWFFIKEKPLIILSSGEQVKNWDCPEAIDWFSFNEYVNSIIDKYEWIVVVGFYLSPLYINFPIDFHILLSYGNNGEKTIRRCIDSRTKTKSINERRDVLMVREIVYPCFYNLIDQLKNNKNIKEIQIFDEITGQRKFIEEIVSEIRIFLT